MENVVFLVTYICYNRQTCENMQLIPWKSTAVTMAIYSRYHGNLRPLPWQSTSVTMATYSRYHGNRKPLPIPWQSTAVIMGTCHCEYVLSDHVQCTCSVFSAERVGRV